MALHLDPADRDAGLLQGLLLSTVSMALIVAISAPVPVLPQMMRAFAGDPQIGRLITLVAVLPAFAIALVSLVAGAIADRIGKRRLLTISAGIFAVSALAPLWLNSFALILVSRVITGVAMGMMIVPAVALTGDYYSGPTRQRWFGIQQGATAVAGVAVSTLSGALGEMGWRFAFLPLLIGPLLFIGLLALPEHRLGAQTDNPDAPAAAQRAPWSLWFLVLPLGFLTSALVCPPSYEMGPILQEKDLGGSGPTGLLMSVIQIGSAVAAFNFARVGRLSLPVSLAIAMLSAAIGAFMIARSPTLILVGFGCVAAGAAQGMLGPLFLTWLMGKTPPGLYGRAVGSAQTLSYLAFFLAPLSARQLAVSLHSSASAMALIAAADLFVALAAITARLSRKPISPSPETQGHTAHSGPPTRLWRGASKGP